MELLPHFGVNSELSREEFGRRLGRECNADQVRELRLSLFEDAVRKQLADGGDELVKRKKVGGGKAVKEKHIEDIWLLVGAIVKCDFVPRILLKNGKRAKDDLVKSQARLRGKRSVECSTVAGLDLRGGAYDNGKVEDIGRVQLVVGGAGPDAVRNLRGAWPDAEGGVGGVVGGARPDTCVSPSEECQDAVFRSTVIESINALREDVMDLRSELRQMKKTGTPSHHTPDKLCTAYVRILEGGPEVGHIGKARLESLLACEVPQYVCIKEHPLPSFKVKCTPSQHEVYPLST